MVPPLLATLSILFVQLATREVAGFATPALSSRTKQPSAAKQLTPRSSKLHLSQTNDDDEEPELLSELIGAETLPTVEDLLKLQLNFSPEEIESLRETLQKTVVDKAVESNLAEIAKLRKSLAQEAIASKERIANARSLNVQLEKQNLLEKIDALSSEFLESTQDFRETTQRIAAVDAVMGTSGRGVDWGSWGNDDGYDVLVGDVRMGRLLGSVDAARRQSVKVAVNEETDGQEKEAAVGPVENRVMVVFDGQKDKGSQRILDELTPLLTTAFDSSIKIDTYTPASNIPMGGNSAQTALIFASSLNDRNSLETLLGRVLKRTAPVAGGKPGIPPSHVVIVSALGTERTNRMPYSMTNMFTGKLDKLREIEQSIVAISRSRAEGGKLPLDYTIVKFGEVANNDGDESEQSINIRPGDALDGEIGPHAAAQILLQSMAYQPYARNSTLCATGTIPKNADIDASTWNDLFVCLSGPELLRIQAGPGTTDTTDNDEKAIDPKFEQLATYIKEWSTAYTGDRKGTGLTTPVLVRNSRKGPSKFDGVVMREGVRILFQTTNTGDRYKSASEDRADEKERNSSVTSSGDNSSKGKLIPKSRKEGGIEVLVEKTTGGELRVRARRCNMDHKTIIKEMSEEVILSSLKKAVVAWVEARSVTGF